MKENTMRSGPTCEEILAIHQQVSATLAASRAKFGAFAMMAEADEKDGETDASDDDASGDADSDDDSGTEGQGDKENKAPKDTSGDDELARTRTRMKAADQRAATAERALQEIKDKDKPELERAQNRVKELEPALESAQSAIRDLRLRVAFLSDNTYSWHDPEDALRLVDMDGVEIDDDGKVVGLKNALKALATTKKHLVKAEKDSDEDEDESEPSGSQRNGKRKGEQKVSSREALAKKYPALRR